MPGLMSPARRLSMAMPGRPDPKSVRATVPKKVRRTPTGWDVAPNPLLRRARSDIAPSGPTAVPPQRQRLVVASRPFGLVRG